MRLDRFYEQIFFSTARIVVGNGNSIGTGFLYIANLDRLKGRSVILLVSNKHVFLDPAKRIDVLFHKLKDDEHAPELGQAIQLTNDNFNHIYTEHPDSNIDLACINVSHINNEPNKIYFRSITEDMHIDFDEEGLFPGLDVWFVGYPDGRFDQNNYLPILRKGFIASIPSVDYNNNKHFLIDAQVFPGSSGSPVFASVKDKFRLLGVVSQTMVRNNRLEVIPSNLTAGVQEVLGLGIVIKADKVYELIKHAKTKIENNFIQSEGANK